MCVLYIVHVHTDLCVYMHVHSWGMSQHSLDLNEWWVKISHKPQVMKSIQNHLICWKLTLCVKKIDRIACVIVITKFSASCETFHWLVLVSYLLQKWIVENENTATKENSFLSASSNEFIGFYWMQFLHLHWSNTKYWYIFASDEFLSLQNSSPKAKTLKCLFCIIVVIQYFQLILIQSSDIIQD